MVESNIWYRKFQDCFVARITAACYQATAGNKIAFKTFIAVFVVVGPQSIDQSFSPKPSFPPSLYMGGNVPNKLLCHLGGGGEGGQWQFSVYSF